MLNMKPIRVRGKYKCHGCKKLFLPKTNKGRNLFCTVKCFNKYQKRFPHTKFLLGKKGKLHPTWTGGKHKSSKGYILVRQPDHPFANCNGYVLENRLVMEKKIGRYLQPKERTHHINGVKDDNRPENIELFRNGSEHFKKYHGKDWNKRVKRNPISGRFLSLK